MASRLIAWTKQSSDAMSEQILLIEDDKRLAEMVADYLGEADYAVTIAGTGTSSAHPVTSR